MMSGTLRREAGQVPGIRGNVISRRISIRGNAFVNAKVRQGPVRGNLKIRSVMTGEHLGISHVTGAARKDVSRMNRNHLGCTKSQRFQSMQQAGSCRDGNRPQRPHTG